MGKKEKKLVCGVAIASIILCSFFSLAALVEDSYSDDQAQASGIALLIGLGGLLASVICLCRVGDELPSFFCRAENTDAQVHLFQVHILANSCQTANKRAKAPLSPSTIERRAVASTPVQTDQTANKRVKVYSLPSKIEKRTIASSPVRAETMNAKQRFFDRIDHIQQNCLPSGEAEQLKDRIGDWQQYDLWEKGQIEKDLRLLENTHEVKHVFRV